MSRLTMTSDRGGVAFTFDLDITCQPSELKKILRLAEKLKHYEDLEEQGKINGGWISVKDRLPEDYGLHLVCLGENGRRVWGKGVHIAWYYSGSKNWSFSFNTAMIEGKESSTEIHSVDVTHWMPLPKPPKEGE